MYLRTLQPYTKDTAAAGHVLVEQVPRYVRVHEHPRRVVLADDRLPVSKVRIVPR